MHGPEDAAGAFLLALNAGDWEGAASWFAPDAAARLQRQVLGFLTAAEAEEPAPARLADTRFPDLPKLLGVTAAELRALSPAAFVARYAESVGLPNLLRSEGSQLPLADAVSEISRHLISCTPGEDGQAAALVQVFWHYGERKHDRGIQTLPLVLTQDGWRVSGADFVGTGVDEMR
jgi:hypothetical protein